MRAWNSVREKVTIEHANGADQLCQSSSVSVAIHEVVDGGEALFGAWELFPERTEESQ